MSAHLDDVSAGTRFRLDRVPDSDLRARLLRLGFLDGQVTCRHRIRNGPVIITRDGTELAIGRSVAADIEVTGVSPT
jgi:ferrous iron transport protein A